MKVVTMMWTLASVLFALPALGDHERTFRCLTSRDKPSVVLVPQLLNNLSSCAYNNLAWRTLPCAEDKVPLDTFSLTSPLLYTIRRWELYYNIDINSAFEQQLDWGNLGQPQLGLTAWGVLLDSWNSQGELCYYNGDPKFGDNLLPRNAGLLSLFILRNSLRSPILKIDMAWKFGKRTACSAVKGTSRALHQLRTINSIIQETGAEGLPPWQVEAEASHYREVYSTDPFLQGLFSGWRNTVFPCPKRMQCQDTMPEKGKIYVPRHSSDYLHRISDIIMQSNKVCLIFGEDHLDKDVYYLAVGNVDSEAYYLH